MSYRFGCKKIRETDNAVLVCDIVSGEEIWFPLSTVDSMHFDGRGDGEIEVADWIARQKGLL
jgi:hypothetical protein